VLNREVDVGYQIAVALVPHSARLRRAQSFRSDLCCLPSYFKKIMVRFHVTALPRFH
jgi:hypothetical protein